MEMQPSPPIPFTNKTEVEQIFASQATARLTLAFCAGWWSAASLFQRAEALKLPGKDTCGSNFLGSGPPRICTSRSSRGRSWGHLAVESILPILEMVTELAIRRWLIILQGLVWGQFSFSSSSLSVFLSLLLLLFIPMSKCCLFLATFPFCSGSDPKVMACLWPSLGHRPTSNKSGEMQALLEGVIGLLPGK